MWFRANKLAVNVSKTKYIIFHSRQKRLNKNICKVYFDNNDIGSPVDNGLFTELGRISSKNPLVQERYKNLGILIDEHLSLDQHNSYLAAKISRSLYFISKVKNTVLPKPALKNLYYALIHPHFLYCASIYSCTSAKNIRKLLIL